MIYDPATDTFSINYGHPPPPPEGPLQRELDRPRHYHSRRPSGTVLAGHQRLREIPRVAARSNLRLPGGSDKAAADSRHGLQSRFISAGSCRNFVSFHGNPVKSPETRNGT